MNIFKRLRYLLVLPLAVIIIGTVGFMLLENLSFLDGFYLTFATISTVGYGDVVAASAGGKVFAIIIIIIGIGTFLTLLTSLAQWIIQRRQLSLHRHRMDMLIGVFYTEVGNKLLHTFTRFDPNIANFRKDFMVTAQWSAAEFQHLKTRLNAYKHNIDVKLLDLEEIRVYLQEKGNLLIHQLENPDLVENERYAELLWAVVHLRDELAARAAFKNLPETDIDHLVIDVERAYMLLTQQWIDYMQYLKNRYPFLFSLALRTNPFVENPSAIVK